MVSPISLFCSVVNGPSPTLDEYAFITPITSSILVGPIPAPEAVPEALQFEDVTYG